MSFVHFLQIFHLWNRAFPIVETSRAKRNSANPSARARNEQSRYRNGIRGRSAFIVPVNLNSTKGKLVTKAFSFNCRCNETMRSRYYDNAMQVTTRKRCNSFDQSRSIDLPLLRYRLPTYRHAISIHTTLGHLKTWRSPCFSSYNDSYDARYNPRYVSGVFVIPENPSHPNGSFKKSYSLAYGSSGYEVVGHSVSLSE